MLTQSDSYVLHVPKISSKTAHSFSTSRSRVSEFRRIQLVFYLYS